MKLHKSLLLFGAGAMLLTACGDGGSSEGTVETAEPTTEETAEETDESTETEETTDEIGEGEENEETLEEESVNETVVDNDEYTITFETAEHLQGELSDREMLRFEFTVDNKTEDTITVQADLVSIDGTMVPMEQIFMSTDVTGGSNATAELEIEDFEGGELPELTGELNLTLNVIDYETFDTIESIEFTTNL